ncbi:hypothetical protein GGTG_02220 [Gaeumannomyces tritici R3-111a-1]|uniref:Uncharacterized protein n=1 Tax=Gaeumannomyces tritici (strain R3-111a-1) TaxID=644352 RepID=J3NLS0_GAET3|nr:hypothetical protein GGTG_02220 [Gaeumannomyces tritici R3-111a-1]EJT82246.1 hypothetical protein GGTG_02220 [Gaeumannomyces tritici R3-111a-1]
MPTAACPPFPVVIRAAPTAAPVLFALDRREYGPIKVSRANSWQRIALAQSTAELIPACRPRPSYDLRQRLRTLCPVGKDDILVGSVWTLARA